MNTYPPTIVYLGLMVGKLEVFNNTVEATIHVLHSLCIAYIGIAANFD